MVAGLVLNCCAIAAGAVFGAVVSFVANSTLVEISVNAFFAPVVEIFLQIERAALHSYGPDPHSAECSAVS